MCFQAAYTRSCGRACGAGVTTGSKEGRVVMLRTIGQRRRLQPMLDKRFCFSMDGMRDTGSHSMKIVLTLR
jgi:hypothetical protein